MLPPAITVTNLTKYYGAHLGVEDVTFSVHPGEIMGFLGPNGSGKTTVMRILLGLIKMSKGSAEILGVPVASIHPHMRRHVGYLPGTLGVYKNLTVRQYFSFLNAMRGGGHLERAAALSERLALNLDASISGLSKGNKQKVGVIQAFMHDPSVLILDEPTVGLDPIVQREVEEMLKESASRNTTVLLSSHVMHEVERVANRAAILDRGRLLVVDDVIGLTSRIARKLTFEFPHEGAETVLRKCRGVLDTSHFGRTVECSVIGPETEVLTAAVSLGVITVSSHEPTLDEVFFYMTGNRHVS